MIDTALNVSARSNVTNGVDQILDKPRCHVVQMTPQTYTTGVIAAITFDSPNSTTIGFDTDGLYIPTTSRTQIVCRTAGLYDVKANIVYAASAAGVGRWAWIRKNGVAATFYGTFIYTVVAAIASTTYCNVATSMALNAGDYLELMGFQDSGGNLATTTNGATAPCAEIYACLIST